MQLLELQNVNTYIAGVQILRNVSFAVEEGEVVCLVGRNGAGKTTTIKSILGLLPVKSGKIIFKGNDITNIRTDKIIKMGVGYSPEDRRLFTDFTVEENLKIPAWGLGKNDLDEDWKREILRLFPELAKVMKSKALHVSGGEGKMVAVARALALKPSLLLLDEPLEGLAPIVVERFIKGIKDIEKMGISMLIAESNISRAIKLSDSICIIERGEVIYKGNAEGVMKNTRLLEIVRGYA